MLTHNHVHVPVFRARAANSLYSAWLSIFYGCPVAFWIPTHLEHHHRFVDGPEDITRTTRRSVKHDLWQALVEAARPHEIEWRWVRGHAGHPQNEYANWLAVRAAKEQSHSGGLVPSGFEAWLERMRERGQYLEYFEFEPPIGQRP